MVCLHIILTKMIIQEKDMTYVGASKSMFKLCLCSIPIQKNNYNKVKSIK